MEGVKETRWRQRRWSKKKDGHNGRSGEKRELKSWVQGIRRRAIVGGKGEKIQTKGKVEEKTTGYVGLTQSEKSGVRYSRARWSETYLFDYTFQSLLVMDGIVRRVGHYPLSQETARGKNKYSGHSD